MTATQALNSSIDILKQCHREGTKIARFVDQVRGPDNSRIAKYSIKKPDLDSLFKDSFWEKLKTKNGHQKWKHAVTEIVVEYVDRKGDIDPGAVDGVLTQVQTHLDILRENVFQNSWNQKPDLVSAAKRFNKFLER